MNTEALQQEPNQKSPSRSGESLFKKFQKLFGKEDNAEQELTDTDSEKNKEFDGTINESQQEQHDLANSINAPEQATKDPFAYAKEQIANKRNTEHGVDVA